MLGGCSRAARAEDGRSRSGGRRSANRLEEVRRQLRVRGVDALLSGGGDW